MPQYSVAERRARRQRMQAMRSRRLPKEQDDDERPPYVIAPRTEPPTHQDLCFVPYGGSGNADENGRNMFAELEIAKAHGIAPAPPQRFTIRHVNGDHMDNRSANLEVVLLDAPASTL